MCKVGVAQVHSLKETKKLANSSIRFMVPGMNNSPQYRKKCIDLYPEKRLDNHFKNIAKNEEMLLNLFVLICYVLICPNMLDLNALWTLIDWFVQEEAK